ncbi:MAG TPA: MarR family transcriptional regulator [Polyangiaceae bacterium]|nr:MarR family transcriptional regulator [Polyangiaceae bacterium]
MPARKPRSTGSQDVSSLETHLGYWLRFVSNHVSHAFGVKLSKREVTVAEWVLMRELYEHESVAPSKLAESLHMTRGAISKIVDRLAEKTLVARRQGEGDRRFQELELTQAGRELVPVLAALADENDAEFFGHLGQRDRDFVQELLKEVVRRRQLSKIPVD